MYIRIKTQNRLKIKLKIIFEEEKSINCQVVIILKKIILEAAMAKRIGNLITIMSYKFSISHNPKLKGLYKIFLFQIIFFSVSLLI